MKTEIGNRISELDWNLLRTFFIIVEEGSLTKAAGRLNVRQPSVSAALQRLEDTVGCILIVRGSRRFELTKYGELLHAECAEIFQNVFRLGEKLAGAERDITGSVRIMSVTDVRYPPFDLSLTRLHQRYPSVQVEIDIAGSRESIRSVSRRLAPVGLCLLTKPIHGLNCRFLMREEFGIFCGNSHPLSGRTDVSLDVLRDEAFAGFSCAADGSSLEPMLALGSSASIGLGSKLSGWSTHLGEVLRMIRSGVGIGILPVASVEREISDGSLWRLMPDHISLGADLYLVTNPDMPLERAEAEYIEILNETIDAFETGETGDKN